MFSSFFASVWKKRRNTAWDYSKTLTQAKTLSCNCLICVSYVHIYSLWTLKAQVWLHGCCHLGSFEAGGDCMGWKGEDGEETQTVRHFADRQQLQQPNEIRGNIFALTLNTWSSFSWTHSHAFTLISEDLKHPPSLVAFMFMNICIMFVQNTKKTVNLSFLHSIKTCSKPFWCSFLMNNSFKL